MVPAVHAPKFDLFWQRVVVLVRDPEVLLTLWALTAEEAIVVDRNTDLEVRLPTAVTQKLHTVGEPESHADSVLQGSDSLSLLAERTPPRRAPMRRTAGASDRPTR